MFIDVYMIQFDDLKLFPNSLLTHNAKKTLTKLNREIIFWVTLSRFSWISIS